MTRALLLYSGSLASQVVLRLAGQVGALDLKVVYFRSPFFRECEELRLSFQRLAARYAFRTYTLKREYLRIASDGTGLPFPCGACRRVLLSKAARAARRFRAEFIITGEVAGRGGMGPEELAKLDVNLGLTGRVLRPLSARSLPATRVEEMGLWSKDALFDFGPDAVGLRALGQELGVQGELSVDRRCLLANPTFAHRLRSVLREGLPTVNTLRLLEFRHFYYLPPDLKIVVAIEREEQQALQTLFLPTDVRLYLPVPWSPLVLARADWSRRTFQERQEAVDIAARIALALAGFPDGESCGVCFRFEWEEETRRLVAIAPGKGWLATLSADGLMSSPVGVYSAS